MESAPVSTRPSLALGEAPFLDADFRNFGASTVGLMMKGNPEVMDEAVQVGVLTSH